MFEISSPVVETPLAGSNSGAESPSTSQGSTTSATHQASVLFAENVDGVTLDAKARFVVPVFRSLPSDGVCALQRKHKVSKVCKTCGSGYPALMQFSNLRSDISENITTVYVFMENPSLNSSSDSESIQLSLTRTAATKRRLLVEKFIPADWT